MLKTCSDENSTVTISCIEDIVTSISHQLKEIPTESEGQFLALGASARECFFSAKNIHKTLTLLLETVSSDANDSISSMVSTIIKNTQDGMKSTLEHHKNNRVFYEDLRKRMRILYRECTNLNSSSTYFNMLSTNIRITSAGIKNAHEMFSSVADSTKQLSDDIHNASDEMSQEIFEFMQGQESLNQKIDKKTYEITKTSNRILSDLKTAQIGLQQIATASEQKMVLIHKKVSTMSEIIGEIVVSVQYHDRMRQRLEHIEEAIIEAYTCVKHVDDTISKIQFFFIIELQLEQINEIETELVQMNNSLNSSFESLLIDSNELYENFKANSGEQDIVGSLEKLSSLLQKQVTIQSSAEEGGKDIQKTIESTVTRINKIHPYLSVIDEWGFQAQFVSLNASVNASKLGVEGSSLAVLSEEIVRQSEQLKVSVKKIKGIIEDLTTIINEKDFDQSGYSEKIAELFTQLQNNIQKLTSNENSVEQPLGDLRHLLEQSQSDAIQLRESLSHFYDLKILLITLRDNLRPLLDEQHLDPENRGVVLSTIYDSYTMEEERRVHNKYFGTIDNTTKPKEEQNKSVKTADNSNAEDDVELFGDDDVELFGDDEEADLGDDVELFGDDEEEADLGDDVELFGDDEEEADLGDDVELFGDDEEETDPGEDVELFGDSEVEKTDLGEDKELLDKNNSEEDDLGENVELF